MDKEKIGDHLQTQIEEVKQYGKKVLILDDDAWYTALLAELLTSQQMDVTVTNSGVEGLKEIMKSDFDVILCDMKMPGLSGDMFYQAVQRAKPAMCDRFIFMSGHHNDPQVRDFIQKVGKKVLWKPFDLYKLLEAINSVGSQSRE